MPEAAGSVIICVIFALGPGFRYDARLEGDKGRRGRCSLRIDGLLAEHLGRF
jgi:hypothetical protein